MWAAAILIENITKDLKWITFIFGLLDVFLA